MIKELDEPTLDGIDAGMALEHLGNVLMMLAELHEDDQCSAYVNALEYYNRMSPNVQVKPVKGYSTRLVHFTPLDEPEKKPPVRSNTDEGKYSDYDQYLKFDLAGWAGYGEVVKYLDKNGNDYDRERCAELGIKVDDRLTVERCDIGSWSSTYTFKEYPGKHFNTVMFDFAEEE